MDIDLVFKIAAIGIVVAVLNQLLVRSDRPDQAMLVSLAGLVTTMTTCIAERSMADCSRWQKGIHRLFSGKFYQHAGKAQSADRRNFIGSA